MKQSLVKNLVAAGKSLLLATLIAQLSCVPGQAVSVAQAPERNTSGWRADALNPPQLIPFAQPAGPPGSVSYTARTTGDGASEISVPIWTPPGRRGVEPRLAISYGSRSGKGLLGRGASLTGLSAISRCWSSLATDGSPPSAPLPDEFCLDGTRLIRLAPSGREYRPEGTPGTKVTAVGGPDFLNPSHFLVYTADGLIRGYGLRDGSTSSSQSRVETSIPIVQDGAGDLTSVTQGPVRAISWKQDSLRDRWGNTVEFDYSRSSSALGRVEVVPTEVRYTSNPVAGLSASRRVRFFYRAASNPTASTIAHVTYEAARVVQRIEVFAERRLTNAPTGALEKYREYRFGYLPVAAGKRNEDRLETITECFGPGQLTCSESLQFDWTDPGQEAPSFAKGSVQPAVSATREPEVSLGMEVVESSVGDFNGDGFDDYLLRRPVIANSSAVFNPMGTIPMASGQLVSYRAEWALSLGGPTGLGPLLTQTGLPGSSGGSPIFGARVLDINRDGRDEILLLTQGSHLAQPGSEAPARFDSGYDVFSFGPPTGNPNGPSAFTARGVGETSSMAFDVGVPIRSWQLAAGDVTGDGFPDLMRNRGITCSGSPCSNTESGNIFIRSANGQGGFTIATPLAIGGTNVLSREAGEQFMVDIEADGVPELLALEHQAGGPTEPDQGPNEFSATFRAFSTRFTSSRRTKLSALKVEDSFAAAGLYSTLEGLPAPALCGSVNTTRNGFVRYFADIDGDGQTDSLAFPYANVDACATVRTWTNVEITSRNVGGVFLPARAARPGPVMGSSETSPGPSRRQMNHASGVVMAASGEQRPVEWSAWRSIDNGLRILDVNDDGRADLVLADSRPSRLNAQVRYGMPDGSFGVVAVDLPGLTLTNIGIYEVAIQGGAYEGVGRGPTSVRFGDYNGDGALDMASLERTSYGFGLATYSQNTRTADAIVRIRGGTVASATPTAEFIYGYAGPQSPQLYTSGLCPSGQACVRKAGWVVSEERHERADFDRAQSAFVVTTHRYGDARRDQNGRGWLGFGLHSTQTSAAGLASTRTRVFNRFDYAGGRFTYSAVQNDSVTVSQPSGLQVLTHSMSAPTLVDDPKCGFRNSSLEATLDQVESGASGTHTMQTRTTTSMYDQYGTQVSVTSATNDGTSPGSHSESSNTQLLGSPNADESIWLVSRYETSSESATASGTTTTRTNARTFYANTTDVQSEIRMSGAPIETALSSGLFLTTTYGYDWQTGNLESVTQLADSRVGAPAYASRTTTVVYDARDKILPVLTTNAEGHSSAEFYEAGSALPVASDDANDLRSEFEFDTRLRPTRARLASGETITFGYEATPGKPRFRTETVSSDVRGSGYVDRDPLGQVVRRGSPSYQLGTIVQEYKFDRMSRLVAESLPFEPRRTPLFVDREYDNLGRIISERRPGETALSPKLERRWEHSGRVTEAFSERGFHSRREVDFAGRMVANSTYLGTRAVTTRLTYGPFGTLKEINHPQLNRAMLPPAPSQLTTTIEYDALGRPTSLNDPDSGLEKRLYTPFGETKRVEDANLGVTIRNYDRLGRLTLASTAANAAYPSVPGAASSHAQLSNFGYDPPNGKGLLGSALSVDGVATVFTYDSRARLATETITIPAEGSFVFGYSYNQRDQLERQVMPPEAANAPPVVLERTYSALNGGLETVSDVTTPGGNEMLWSLISRNAAGQATGEQYGPNASGAAVTRAFDSSFQLRVQETRNTTTNAILQKLAYRWGADGLLTKKTDLVVGVEETYEHDELERLQKWKVLQNCLNSEWSYDYDDWGNLRERSLNGQLRMQNLYTKAGVTGPAHGIKELVEGSNQAQYRYLAGGQVSVGGDNTFTWRPFGLPSSVVNASGARSDYRYDAFGKRVLEIAQSGGLTRRIITLGARYEKRIEANGGAVHAYGIETEEGQVGQVRRATNSGGVLTARQVQFFHSDHLGSPDTISREGQVIDRPKYEPFGERRHHWAVAQPIRASHGVNASFGFTGHQPEDGLGLVNMRGRVYDPRTTRFNSPDPIGQPWSEGLNRLSYVRNSPVHRIDPSGYEDEPPTNLKPGVPTTDKSGMVWLEICLSCKDESTPQQPKPVGPMSDASSSASGPMTTASDVADRWDSDARAKTYGIFADRIDPSAPLHEHIGYAATVLSIELGAGFVEALRLGKGAAEGTLSGVVSDGLRALSLVGAMKGATRPLTARTSPVQLGRLAAGCFAAGTLVSTPAGTIPIEEISSGQSVRSIELSGAELNQTVLGAETLLYSGSLLVLRLDDASTISVTPNHPFCVVGGSELSSRRWPLDIGSDSPNCNQGEGRWVEAGDLRAGDSLLSVSGERTVRNVAATSFQGEVYNIAVSRSHTYLVGLSGLVVHNKAALSPVGVAKSLAERIDPSVCKYGMCEEFAIELENALRKAGVSGEQLKVLPRSDVTLNIRHGGGVMAVGDKGRPHFAVKVGDVVFGCRSHFTRPPFVAWPRTGARAWVMLAA